MKFVIEKSFEFVIEKSFEFVIEKSFEGEFRVVLRNNDDDNDLITMPWVVRETTAMQQFAKVLSNWVDVKYALQTNTPVSREYLKKVIDGTFKTRL